MVTENPLCCSDMKIMYLVLQSWERKGEYA